MSEPLSITATAGIPWIWTTAPLALLPWSGTCTRLTCSSKSNRSPTSGVSPDSEPSAVRSFTDPLGLLLLPGFRKLGLPLPLLSVRLDGQLLAKWQWLYWAQSRESIQYMRGGAIAESVNLAKLHELE